LLAHDGRDLPVGEGLTADYIMGAVAPYAGSYYSVNRLTFNIPYKRRLAYATHTASFHSLKAIYIL
jgi:hypothetical protein